MSSFEVLAKQKTEIQEKYNREMREVKHWEDVCKKFSKMQKKGVDVFTMDFPHTGNLDNEAKIAKYADEFGFVVANEELGLLTSVYSFKRKD